MKTAIIDEDRLWLRICKKNLIEHRAEKVEDAVGAIRMSGQAAKREIGKHISFSLIHARAHTRERAGERKSKQRVSAHKYSYYSTRRILVPPSSWRSKGGMHICAGGDEQ